VQTGKYLATFRSIAIFQQVQLLVDCMTLTMRVLMSVETSGTITERHGVTPWKTLIFS